MPSTTQELRTEIDKIDGRIGLLRDLKAEKLKALRAAKAREDRQELLKLRLQSSLKHSDAAMATRGDKEAKEEPGPQLVLVPLTDAEMAELVWNAKGKPIKVPPGRRMPTQAEQDARPPKYITAEFLTPEQRAQEQVTRKPVLNDDGEQAYDFDGNPLWQD